MRPDSPSKFQGATLSQDTTLDQRNFLTEGLFVVDTSGLTLTLPVPTFALQGVEGLIVNSSSGSVNLSCSGGFVGGGDQVTLSAGASVYLYGCETGNAGYKWALVGATAS
jgi:hypothetical protein